VANGTWRFKLVREPIWCHYWHCILRVYSVDAAIDASIFCSR
jgi:hypothetical protein